MRYQREPVGITVTRHLTRDQVVREIRCLEKYERVPDKALRTKRISEVEIERWRSLLHALEAYEEGEGIDVTVEERFHSIRPLRKVLTDRRMRVLEQIGLGVGSITELAKRAGPRDIKNVYDDLQILKKFGFVTLERDGRRVVPRLLLSSVRLDFR
jgi:predicted transcriptional regulator